MLLPAENLSLFSKEVEQMALASFKKSGGSDERSKNEVKILRKLGLAPEEIDQLPPGQSPFKNYTLGQKNDLGALLEAQ